MSYDVIVIGSGIGGLTTAGLLARAAGKRVLVLERHTEPGGLTHTFRRDGASWDVGVHYIGHLGPGSQGRAYFDYLSGGELEWNRMPDAYDRFVYPGVDLCVSSDPVRYERDLVAGFPQEVRVIHRYFQDVQRVSRWVTLGLAQGMVPRPAASLLRAAQRLGGRRATGTTKAYLDAHFRSPELKAVLASQWGDYGLPPSQSAFAVHALIVSHYLEGAWFPAVGALGSPAPSRRASSRLEALSASRRRSPRFSPRTGRRSGSESWTTAAPRYANASTAPRSSCPPSAPATPSTACCPHSERSGGAPGPYAARWSTWVRARPRLPSSYACVMTRAASASMVETSG